MSADEGFSFTRPDKRELSEIVAYSAKLRAKESGQEHSQTLLAVAFLQGRTASQTGHKMYIPNRKDLLNSSYIIYKKSNNVIVVIIYVYFHANKI